MKARSSKELLHKLRLRTEENLSIAEQMATLPTAVLELRASEKSWSALDCFAHLNHFSAYYLPEIQKQITQSKHPSSTEFTSSWLGNYFANGMKPGENIKKIKTLPSGNPLNFKSAIDRGVLAVFIKDQQEILRLLTMAADVDLTKTKTGISITNLIKIRLGDTLRVVVYHNWRHIEQAKKAIAFSEQQVAAPI